MAFLTTTVAGALAAALAVITPGGLFGVGDKGRQLYRQIFSPTVMQFTHLTDSDRKLAFSVDNLGDDVVEITNFRIEHIDDDVRKLMKFGQFKGAADVPNGRHDVSVEVEYIKPDESLHFFEVQGRQSFFERFGERRIGFAADATRRGKKRTIRDDVSLNDIRAFIANRASPLEVLP